MITYPTKTLQMFEKHHIYSPFTALLEAKIDLYVWRESTQWPQKAHLYFVYPLRKTGKLS